MSFVYDDTDLPGEKVDAAPPRSPANKQFPAADFNALRNALNDTRDALIAAEYFGFVDSPAAAISASGGARLRLNGTDLEASIDGAAYRRLSSARTIDANAMFGLVPNAEDSTTGLLALRTHARANPYTTYEFAPGIYDYGAPIITGLISGTLGIKFHGYGAQFRQTHVWPWVAGADTLYFNPTLFQENDEFVAGHLIETVEAHEDEIVFATPAEAASDDYAVGNNILVYGFTIQIGGYPPNPRYFEYRKVVGRNLGTGTLQLDRTLKNRYDSRWYDDTSNPDFVTGAARVKSLDRVNPSNVGGDPYRFGEYAEFEGIEFLDHKTNQTNPELTFGHGHINTHGFRKVVFRNCKIGSAFPSENERQEFYGCQIGWMELDKIVDSALFDNCEIQSLVGATDYRSLELRQCSVYDEYACAAKQTLNSNCRFYCTVSTGGSYRDCLFSKRDPGDGHFGGASERRTLAAATAVTATSITIPVADGVSELAYINIGTKLYLGAISDGSLSPRSNWGTVTNMYQATTNMVIEADFVKTPTIGDQFQYRCGQSFSIDHCFDQDTGEPVIMPFADRIEHNHDSINSVQARRVVRAFPQGSSLIIPINGHIVGMQFIPTDVAVHPAGGYVNLAVYDQTINTTVLGSRHVGLHADLCKGPVSGFDNLATLSAEYQADVEVTIEGQFATVPTTYGKGIIIIDVVDRV